MRSKNNNDMYKSEKQQGSSTMDGQGLDLVKAAAWAWYERAHRNSSTGVKECNPRYFFARKPSASVYRPSRFRAEAAAERKRGGSTKYTDVYNNRAKRHSFDTSLLSSSTRTVFAADGRSSGEEAEYLTSLNNLDSSDNSLLSRSACTNFIADGRNSGEEVEYLRSIHNLDDKCSQRWDFRKSLLDSYEIVAIFKNVDNYAPFNADTEAAPATDKDENINANSQNSVADLCLLSSGDGRSMCTRRSEMAGVLEIGTAQKQRSLRSVFPLGALSERLKSLAHFRFVRFRHGDRKQHKDHRGQHRPYHNPDINH